MTAKLGVLDADGHVLEPREAWASLPDEHRPRIETDAGGYDHVIVGDAEVFTARLGQMGTPGADIGAARGAIPRSCCMRSRTPWSR